MKAEEQLLMSSRFLLKDLPTHAKPRYPGEAGIKANPPTVLVQILLRNRR
jgi:hypothetical protein